MVGTVFGTVEDEGEEVEVGSFKEIEDGSGGSAGEKEWEGGEVLTDSR